MNPGRPCVKQAASPLSCLQLLCGFSYTAKQMQKQVVELSVLKNKDRGEGSWEQQAWRMLVADSTGHIVALLTMHHAGH